MPLLDRDIQEQGDVLAAQRSPGFETEGLPSPNGFEAPQIAPIPIPGTGMTEDGNSQGAYLNQFNQSILGTKDKLTPGNLPEYQVSDVYNPRYRSILPGEDSEEAFAKGQPWYKQWGNAIAKMGAIGVGTFVNGLMAIPDTINSLGGGSPYSTSMGGSVDTWLKNLEDTFPNYYTKWQTDHPFMSALPFSGGFSNFWGDKFLKNLGYTVGAIGSAIVTDAAIGMATAGLGEIPLIGSQIGRAALWLNKLLTGTNDAERLMNLGRAAGRTGEQLFDLKQLAQAAAGTKISNGARYAINLYGASASEAGFEARDAYNSVKDDLLKSYQKEKGYSATGKDLDEIETYAKSAGNVRFGVNLALLGISNAIQFDAILKPFNVAKAGFRSSIQKAINENATIGLTEGSLDTFERVVPKGIWGKIRPVIPAVLSEGVFEEGGQFATEIATKNFYERKYLYDKGLPKSSYTKDDTPWDSRDQVKNVVHSIVEGLKDEFSTDEGLENVLLGGLTGAVFGGVERFLDREKNAKTTATVLNLLNGQGVTGILQNMYDSTATAHRIAEDMKEAVKNNDIFKYKNFQHEQFVNFIVSGAKAGRFDVRMEQLKMLKEMDNEEFKKAFGLDKTNDNVKTASEYVDALIQKADKIKKSYDLINDTFTNPFNFNPKSSTPEQALENQKHQVFEGWKDDLTFLASIGADVDSRLESISSDLRSINPNLSYYHVANFTDKKYLKNYAANLEKERVSIQSLLDQKVSGDREADERRVKSLEIKGKLIDSYLTDPSFSEKRFEGLFKQLLTFHLNGDQDEGFVVIPQEAVPKLVQYGHDAQRLRNYKESAYKAFDRLSTQEGFEKYFTEAHEVQDTYAQKPPPPPPPAANPPTTPPSPTGPTSPTGATKPPVPKTVSVKDKSGVAKEFDPNQEYYVNIGSDKDPVKGFVIEQKPDGKVVVQTSDGTSYEVAPETFLAKDKNAESVKKDIDINTSKDDIPPPVPIDKGTKEGQDKKDITFGLKSTKDPVYSRQDIPFNNFHRRHQNFLYDMGSTDPDVFNQANKPKLRIIPVTAKTYKALGFPEGFISPDDKGTDTNNSTIKAVYVVDDTIDPFVRKKQRDAIVRSVLNSKKATDIVKGNFKSNPETAIREWYEQLANNNALNIAESEKMFTESTVEKILDYGSQGMFFVDSKGNKLGAVGSTVDPNVAIFSTFASTELKFQASPGVFEDNYTNKEKIDETEAQNWWREQRADILTVDTPQGAMQRAYQFAISRGKPNIANRNSRNNVLEVGLIRERDLDKSIITLPTLGDVAVLGAFNEDDEGIASSKTGVNMPLGTPLLNFGGNLTYLNARKFTKSEASNIFEMLKIISDRNRTVESGPLFKYLHKIIYMANPEKGIAPTPSSITIDKFGNLFLGTNTNPIQLLPQALDDTKDQIMTFLEGAYHNIKNSELLRIKNDPKANDLEFAELKADDGKVEVVNRWKNYNYYLLSDKTPEGKKRADSPLATNLVVPQEGERPLIQKYSEILSLDFDYSKFKIPQTVEEHEAETKPVSELDAKAALAKVIADAKIVGMTVGNILEIREAYIQDPNLSKEEKSILAGAADLLISHIEKKDKEQGVKQQGATKKESVQEKEPINKERQKIKDDLKTFKAGRYTPTGRAEERVVGDNIVLEVEDALNIVSGFKRSLDEEDRKNVDKILDFFHKGLTVNQLEYLSKKYDNLKESFGKIKEGEEVKPMAPPEVVAEQEKRAEEEKAAKQEPIEFIEVADKKFGFRTLSRDSEGNITDVEAIGVIGDDNKITPYKDPEGMRMSIMKLITRSYIKEDDTNSDTTKSTADKFKGRNFKRGTDRFRRAYPGNNDYVKADLDKEFAEVKQIINGDFFKFKKLDEMLRTTEGGLAWGALQDDMIHIYKNAEVGTTYHEAFEAVWYHFVTGKEQQDIYDEFVTRKGEFTTYNGAKKAFSEATVKEAKEQLAEEFRDYKMTGKLPAQEKQKSFFRKLLDFIKWLLGMETSDRNKMFKKMNKGYYRNYTTSLRGAMNQPEYSYYREPGLEGFSEAIVQDLLQGMTAELFGEIFGENTSVIDALEEDFKAAAKTVYDKLKQKFTDYFEDEVAEEGTLFAETGFDWEHASNDDDRSAIIQQMDSIREVWTKVKDNWASFVKEHERYLRVFNAEFIIDDDGEITMAEGEDESDSENKDQSSYDRDIMTMDVKQSSGNRMKLLVASIADSEWIREATKASIDSVRSKREVSSMRLPRLVQYAKLFNYLLHNTAGINGIYDIWGKLTQMTDNVLTRKLIDANVRKFMSRLKFDDGFEDKSQSDVRMIMSAENTLTKQKPGFFRQFTDYKKNTYFKTTVLNSKIDQVKGNWISAIKGSKAIAPAAENRFMFTKAVVGIKDNVELLNALGIRISKDDYNRLRGSNITRFNDAVNKVRSLIEKAVRDKIAIPIVSSKQLDFDSRLTDLADLYVTQMVGEDTQSQHPNLENEQTSNFVLNNWVSTMVNDLNNSNNKDEFINRENNGYFFDPFHQDSLLLTKIAFDKDGNKNKSIQVGVVEGRESWDKNNKATSKLTDAERLLYEINNNLNGVFYTLLPADAKTEWALYIGTYLSSDGFFGDDSSRSNEITAFGAQMYKWLKTEVALAKDYENRKFIDALTRKPKGETREVGRSLRFFKDIFTSIGKQGIVDEINTKIIDGDTPLEDVVSSSDMRAYMKEYAEEKVKDTLNELLDWRVVQLREDGEIKLYGFDKAIIDKTVGKKYTHTRAEVERLLMFREMNYVMNNIEMHKFFFGDPAQYKDELKRIKSFLSGREYTHVDMLGTSEGFNQWANTELNKAGEVELLPGDPGYQFHKNHYNTATSYDVTYESDSIDDIEKAIGKEAAKPYTEGNEDDAGAYITAPSYRETMWKSGGRFTKRQEDQFQWEMAYERNKKAEKGQYTYSSKALRDHDTELLKKEPDTKAYYPIIKLMHSGIQEKDGVAIVSLDKASWAPLFYRWYENRGLGKLYDAMQKRGIDYIRMESAHKVGIQKPSSFSLYNETGSINSEAFDTMEPEMIPMKQIGIQVEQAKKEKGQTEGSQLRKIDIGDLREDGVPLDFQKDYATHQEAYAAWNNLETEDQRKAASPIYTKIKRHNQALINLTGIRTQLAMRRMGMEEGEDGSVTIPDKKMISDFILSELERRELPRNIASGVQISPETRDFSNPIEANPQYTKIRSIIYSVLEKTVTRPKVNGGQKTMLSVTGMETGPRIVKRIVNGKPVYTTETLKFYKQNDSGTEACEVMLPYWFGKKLKEANSNKTDEEILHYLNSTEEGKKLLSGIGFRIPTQGLNSIDFFIVKGFLPEQMGDVIVLPAEITAKAGSDFDIDKLNVYLRNFYIDNNDGLPKLLKFKGSEAATKEDLTKLIQGGFLKQASIKADLKDYIDAEMEALDEEGLLVNNEDYNSRLVEDFVRNMDANILDMYYQKTLENEYFDAIQDLISLPENYSRLIAPNDATELKDYRKEVLKLKATSAKPLGDYGKLLSSTFMMKERQAYMSSKQVVGISAVSQTAHAIAQNIQGGLLIEDSSIIARFPANMIDGKISLSGLTTAGGGSLISNTNSQTTDGGVDVAKDKFLAEMAINRDTLSTFLALRRMGATPWWAILYLNQPIIQEFLKIKAISKSVSQINPAVKDMSDSKLLDQVMRRFGAGGKKTKSFVANKPKYYGTGEMERMISSYATNPAALSAEEKKLQIQILDDFSRYNRSKGKYEGYSALAWDLFHFYQGYNWDTATLNDPNLVEFKLLKYQKANELSITPASKVMADTFIGPMKDNLLRLNEGLKSIVNVQSGAAGETLRLLIGDIFQMAGGEAVKQQLALTAELSLVDFAIQTNALVEGIVMNTLIQPLILSSKATAVYVDALKRHIDKKLSENPLLRALVPTIDRREGYPSLVQLLERDYDTYTSNVYTDSLRELRDDNTVISINSNSDDDRTVSQIYKRMVATAIIQGGARSGRGAYSHLIPSESYSEIVRDSLRNMRLDGFYENLALYRGNWSNTMLVPNATKEFLTEEEQYIEGAEPYYIFFVNPKVTSTLGKIMNLDPKNTPMLISQPANMKYRKAKVIKTEEIIRDPNTSQIISRKIRLFRRIDVMSKNGVVPLVLTYNKFRVFFAEINAWGDTGIREYYNGQNQSALPENAKVIEASDEQIIYAISKSDIKTNVAEDVIDDVVRMFEEDERTYDGEEDAEGNEPPDQSPFLQMDNFQDFKNKLESKNCK